MLTGPFIMSNEDPELAELRDLFAGDRESPIPVGVYVKYMTTQENRMKGDLAREEKQERVRQREEKSRQQQEVMQARKAAVRSRKHGEKLAYEEGVQAQARSVREQEAMWAEARRRDISVLQASMKGRVKEARGLDARLDAQEAAVDEQERVEGTAAKVATSAAVSRVREKAAQQNKEKVERVRNEVSFSLSTALGLRQQQNARKAEQKREYAAKGVAEQQRKEQERLRHVAKLKAAALSSRSNALKVREDMIKQRQVEALNMDRENTREMHQAKGALLDTNRHPTSMSTHKPTLDAHTTSVLAGRPPIPSYP